MSATPTNTPDGGGCTLGELLYADQGRSRASEEEWVALVRSIALGDHAALRALYDRAHRLVFTLALRISGNRQTAEEVTIAVFHDAWRRASAYDAKNGPVLAWLMNQARSRAIDRLRYDQRKKRHAPAEGESQVADAEPAAASAHEHRMLTAGLAMLSPEERQAIETAFFADLTYAETATRLRQPLGAVKSRIRTGLEKLRRAFEAGMRTP